MWEMSNRIAVSKASFDFFPQSICVASSSLCASSPTSPFLKKMPVLPMISRLVGRSDEITGSPWAIASTSTNPKPSHRELNT